MSSVMSLQGYIDRDYQATRMSADEQKRWEREHSCHRQGCDASIEGTQKCDFCGAHFCDGHRIDYDGTCACLSCAKHDMDIDDAAEALEQARRAA